MAAVVLLVFAIITIKRGLVKGIVSAVGFVLAVVIAITTSGGIAESLYSNTARTSNVNEINKHIDDGTFVEMLSTELENMDYNLAVDRTKLDKVLTDSKDYDKSIFKYVNNINGKKVAEEEEFIPKLHQAYGNVIRDLTAKGLSTFSAERAAEKVVEKPSLMTPLIPLLLETDDHKPAADYICKNFLDESYTYSFKFVIMVVMLIVVFVFSIIIAGAIGRNDTMEPGIGRHLFCGLLGLIKGAAVVAAIAIVVRTLAIYGTDKRLMTEYPAIDKSYAFKYVYDFICGLK